MSNPSAALGIVAGSTGVATVTDAGSTWHSSGNLSVGGGINGAGGNGELTVGNSGLVEVDGTLQLWSTGTVTLDGGSLNAQIAVRSYQ
ncbi:MAG: hypothetical protein R3C45_13020 [Phycisphaerales bacterium]